MTIQERKNDVNAADLVLMTFLLLLWRTTVLRAFAALAFGPQQRRFYVHFDIIFYFWNVAEGTKPTCFMAVLWCPHHTR